MSESGKNNTIRMPSNILVNRFIINEHKDECAKDNPFRIGGPKRQKDATFLLRLFCISAREAVIIRQTHVLQPY